MLDQGSEAREPKRNPLMVIMNNSISGVKFVESLE